MLNHLKNELASKGSVRFAVRAVPGASATQCTEVLEDESVKVRIAAPAENGKANKALIRFLAKEFGVSSQEVSIVSGATLRHKLIAITCS